MPNQDHNKVSLEDLLRLKRAERPSADFWPRFERELRAKQLAAIVQKQPWWRAWLPFPAGFARLAARLTAVAVLAFVLIVTREAAPSRSMPTTTAGAASPSALPETSSDGTQSMLVAAADTTNLDGVGSSSQSASNDLEPAVPALLADVTVATSTSGTASQEVTPAGPDTRSLMAVAAFTGINVLDGAGTVTLSPAENSFAGILADTTSFSASAGFAAVTTVDPAAGVELANNPAAESSADTLPNAVRTGFLPSAKKLPETGPVSVSAVELVSHRLSASEELLYASARRIVDLAGNSVSVRF
jgi:hypothetical protein